MFTKSNYTPKNGVCTAVLKYNDSMEDWQVVKANETKVAYIANQSGHFVAYCGFDGPSRDISKAVHIKQQHTYSWTNPLPAKYSIRLMEVSKQLGINRAA